MLEVVAALVRDGERFLICRRPENKARGGQWEFAGGKVEPGESRQQAIIREFREELDVELEAGEVLADVEYRYPEIAVHLFLLEAKIASGKLKKLEHSETAWVTAREAAEYDLCPADRILLEKIYGGK